MDKKAKVLPLNSHTRENWVLINDVWIRNSYGSPVLLKEMPLTRSDAARVVECVNACRGFKNPSAIRELLDSAQKILKVSGKDPFSPIGHISGILEGALSKLKEG